MEERVGSFTLVDFSMLCRGAVGWSEVSDCGIYGFTSLLFDRVESLRKR